MISNRGSCRRGFVRILIITGEFLESDRNNFVGVWRDYLRIQVRVQVDKPLKRRMKIKKRRMKIKKSGGDWLWVNFKYEHVPTFCFICRLLGHAEKLCSRLFEMPVDEIEKPYGPWMKAVPRRQPYLTGSKWLRLGASNQTPVTDDGSSRKGTGMDVDEGGKSGNVNQDPKSKGSGSVKDGKSAINQERMDMDEGNLAEDITSNNVNNANRLADDPEYSFNDPKRKRPNESTKPNPPSENNGLSKTLQMAGLNGEACLGL